MSADPDLALCSCGHSRGGHRWSDGTDPDDPRPCLHEDGCDEFRHTGQYRDEAPKPPALNFWEMES